MSCTLKISINIYFKLRIVHGSTIVQTKFVWIVVICRNCSHARSRAGRRVILIEARQWVGLDWNCQQTADSREQTANSREQSNRPPEVQSQPPLDCFEEEKLYLILGDIKSILKHRNSAKLPWHHTFISLKKWKSRKCLGKNWNKGRRP